MTAMLSGAEMVVQSLIEEGVEPWRNEYHYGDCNRVYGFDSHDRHFR